MDKVNSNYVSNSFARKSPFQTLVKRMRGSVVSYVFLLPFIVGTAIFTVYPIVMSLTFSFSDFNGAFATKVGLFNFINIFDVSKGGDFFAIMGSFAVTFIYVICSTVLNLVLSYILALFLRRNIRGIGVIRLLCYLPCIIPALASGIIWRDAMGFSSADTIVRQGLFNTYLMKMGLNPFPFFSSAATALPTLVCSSLWGIGGGMIMWIAAFKNISPDLYEASRIDGAGYFKQLFKITIPLSTPMLFYNLVTSLIAGLQIFVTYASYGKGPEDSLYFIAIRIYETAFVNRNPNYGLACAMAWLLFVIIAILTLIMFKSGKWVQYGEDND